jgi:hypothetical protein
MEKAGIRRRDQSKFIKPASRIAINLCCSLKPSAAREPDVKGRAIYKYLVVSFRWLLLDPYIEQSDRREFGRCLGHEFDATPANDAVAAQHSLMDIPLDSDRWHFRSCTVLIMPGIRREEKLY